MKLKSTVELLALWLSIDYFSKSRFYNQINIPGHNNVTTRLYIN